MNINRQQAKALGVGHLWPTRTPSPDGMNKLERSFWERLQTAVKANQFEAAWREPIILKLAGRTTYKPDFMTLSLFNNQLAFWEVKGFMRDDAAVKLKVAASAFPCFRWVLAQKDRGAWRCIEVTTRGFAREPYCPDWLI